MSPGDSFENLFVYPSSLVNQSDVNYTWASACQRHGIDVPSASVYQSDVFDSASASACQSDGIDVALASASQSDD